jgi:MscS family membrane protein
MSKEIILDQINALLAWKWPVLILIFIFSFVINKIFHHYILKWIHHKFLKDKLEFDFSKTTFIIPSYLLLTSILINYVVPFIAFTPEISTRILGINTFVLSFSLFWLAFFVINTATNYFEQLAEHTENKFDDILIPMVSKTIKVLIFCLAVLYVAQSLSIDVTNILAGLGIGGLAFALAAKDSLSNFFGSLMIVLDRPFQIGDWVLVNKNLEGTVVKVGFRSTRIRTFYDSVISIPNSQLSAQEIDNFGHRRYRRMKTYLGVQYDTEPEKIEAFCEGIRNIIAKHPHTRKDYFHVYFNRFSASSLDILVYVFFDVPEWSSELNEKHRLLIDILRLAKELGVSFAFPSNTLYFNRPKKEEVKPSDVNDWFHRSELYSEQIIRQNITPKEPRSTVSGKGSLPPREI